MSSIVEMRNGPALLRFGRLTPMEPEPVIASAPSSTPPSLRFDERGVPEIDEPWDFGTRRDQLRKSSRVSRARSAAFVTAYSAVLADALVKTVDIPRERYGVAVAATSATAAVAYQLERQGLRDGWHLIDPFGLQNSIPSALPTQVATVIGAKGFAVTYLDGMHGFVYALEHAAHALHRRSASAAVVLAADELTTVQQIALETLGRRPALGEGAAGVILGSAQDTSDEDKPWRLALLGHGTGRFQPEWLPEQWRGVNQKFITSADDLAPSCIAAAPLALWSLLANSSRRALLVTMIPGIDWSAAGFVRGDDEG